MVLPGHPAAADCALLGAGHPAGIGGVGVWQAVHSRRCYRRRPRQMGLAGRCPGQPAGHCLAAVHVRHHSSGCLFFRTGRQGRSSGGVHDVLRAAQPAAIALFSSVGTDGAGRPVRLLLPVRLRGGMAGPRIFRDRPFFHFSGFHLRASRTRTPIRWFAICSTCCATSGPPPRGWLWASC